MSTDEWLQYMQARAERLRPLLQDAVPNTEYDEAASAAFLLNEDLGGQ